MNVLRTLAALAVPCFAICTCAPNPKSVSCSNHGECEKVDPKFAYCLDHKCVECIADSSCDYPSRCIDGFCEHKCTDGRDCGDEQVCTAGKCTSR